MARTLAQLWLILMVALAGGCQGRVNYRIDAHFPVSDPQFAQTVGNLLGPALTPGNKVTTLLNGDEIFPAMLEAIEHAQKSITLETYIYWSGEVGKKFAVALEKRARAGVKVYVLIDAYGSGLVSATDLQAMRDAGVNVYKYNDFQFYNPQSYVKMDHRTHRKLLIVDGTVGFTGGVGLADMWDGHAEDADHWRDNHYRIEGPVVAQLQAVFAENWMRTCGDVLEGDAFFPPLSPQGGQWAQVFKSTPELDSVTVELVMLLSFAHAQQHIRIESPYFVLDGQSRKALLDAAQRGVKIEIIVPGRHIDEKIVRMASRADWGDLLKAGVEIYEYQPTMIHSKLLIVDDVWTSIGSSNMDNRSFHINDEANLNVLDAQFAARQTQVFEMDKAKCRRITLEEWQKRPLTVLLGEWWSSVFRAEL